MLVRPAAVLLLVSLFACAGAGLLCAATCVHTADRADTASENCHREAASSGADLTGAPSVCHDETNATASIVAERLVRADAPLSDSVPVIERSGRIHTARILTPDPRRHPDIILIAPPLRI